MNILNKEFDKVVCINLSERKDKREVMQKKFDDLGIEVEWYTAVQYGFIPRLAKVINSSGIGKFNENQPYEIGAALSHYSVIKQALNEGAEKILVFEDDVLFHKEFNNKVEKYLQDAPTDWDLLLFYSFMYSYQPQNIRVSKRWMKSYDSWSLMSYAINKRGMTEYIRMQDEHFQIADLVTYLMQRNNRFNIYSAVPSICIPATKMGSNIRGNNMNYEKKPTITNMGYSDDHYE